MSTELSHPFLDHLASVLSAFERGSAPTTAVPPYDGPETAQTRSILRSVEIIGRRMVAAEGALDNGGAHANPRRVDDQRAMPLPAGGNIVPSADAVGQGDEAVHASPMDIPPGPPGTAAREDEMSPLGQLRLLQAHVSDVVHVCDAIRLGDLSTAVTAPVHGPVMTQATAAVNAMAREVAARVRGATAVARAIAAGEFARQLEIGEAGGEMRECSDAVGAMLVKLKTIAAQVTRVATDVGVDGRLGGQISVPGAEGAWLEMIRGVRALSTPTSKW